LGVSYRKGGSEVDTCKECKRLGKNAANAYASWREQRAVNSQWGEKGKAAKKLEADRYFAYEVAIAEFHTHEAHYHPQLGHHTSARDVEVTLEDFRKRNPPRNFPFLS
jgi:hypothetical protein